MDESETEQHPRTETGTYWVTFAVLLILGFFASCFLSFVFVMSSGQNLTAALPWCGWAGAIVTSSIAGRLRTRSPYAGWWGMSLAALLYLGCAIAGFAIANTAAG